MSKWLKWLDGKKLIIGTTCLILATVGEEVVAGIWGVRTDVVPKIIDTLKWFGTALGGVGLIHKGFKVKNGGK